MNEIHMDPDAYNRGDEKATGFHGRLHRRTSLELSPDTGQTIGLRRLEALSARSVGSRGLWMGQTHVAQASGSAIHHHGRSETGIYVLSGHPVFVFQEGKKAVMLDTSPGDYVYVPPWVPHQELNPAEEEAVVVIARNTQEAIVVNLPEVWVL